MNKNICPLLVFFLSVCHVVAAQYGDLHKSIKSKYQDDPAVFVERTEVLSIIPKEDSLEILADVFEDMLHLKENADAFSAGRVYGSHFTQVKTIKAKTMVWDRNRFREMIVSDFKKNSDRDAGIFYDDSYYYSFSYPSVAMGNRTQLQYSSVIKDPRFIPGYIFPTYAPQAKVSYTVKTTKDVELVYTVINDPGHRINFKKFTKNGFDYYEWTSADVPVRRHEESSPSLRYFEPHVICYVKSYTIRDKKINVLSGIGDLYNWYFGFVKNLDKENSPGLKQVIDKIRLTAKTDDEIARSVFYWVQDNIQYVAFEEGMRGLIPHNGDYVCSKRYGDCKDMANLIVALLKEANIKAYHTWIGTRDLPYRYSEIPTPLVDNHMIATYVASDGRYYFLDATGDHTPFGMPSSMIQGKEALIGFGPGKFEVKVVPVISREENVTADSVFIEIDPAGNQVAGNGVTTLTGYSKIFGAYQLDRAEQEDVRRNVIELTGKGSNKFYLDKYELSGITERSNPTRIRYSFRIGDYYQKIGNELYVNLNLNKDFYNASINTALRQTPRESEFRYEKTEVCELRIPQGYSVEYLPENSESSGKLLGFRIEYQHINDKVILTKRLYSDFLLLMPEQFEEWNQEVKQLSDMYKESIILKKM